MPKTIRFPADLERAIAAIAKREDRSFTAQTLRMLREWLALKEPRASAE